MAPVSLFRLPREVRDIVYRYYVTVSGGLVCDTEAFVNGKLRGKHEPLSFSLVYTCKQISAEMDRGGIALRYNVLTFSTIWDRDLGHLAWAFDGLVNGVDELRCEIFHLVGHSITDTIYDEMAAEYPQFLPLLDRMREEGPRFPGEEPLSTERHGPYGEAPSVYREFIKDLLRKAVKHDDAFRQAVVNCRLLDHRVNKHRYEVDQGWSTFDAIRSSTELWAIPSERQMSELNFILGWAWQRHFTKASARETSKFRFSAAAAAVHFLENTPHELRKHLREIVLDEDREAVAHPECHARGLIPFCEQYPLRIERRANLWRNVFQKDFNYDSPSARVNPMFDVTITPLFLSSDQITANVSSWIAEALALSSAGMPPAAFSLVLDGNPAPDLCSRIFQAVVQRDVGWQLAWQKSLDRRLLPYMTWYERRGEGVPRHGYVTLTALSQFQNRVLPADYGGYWGYFFEGFPDAMEDIRKGDSVVRCNFDIGQPFDVDQIVSEHRTWSSFKWITEWFNHEPWFWETEAPLPEWRGLVEENMFDVAEEEGMHRRRRYWH
ncbi:hypothetical protein CkaCkLH20_08202 [Colletotrichum karsti]|uniref:Uncharacterized protein n=1 Tax=Colletotrichum karsti TaxID=1095194 RepID=A0A9P6I0W5_9PEZI|nr:uncharacterized protein CkaCkLH20_08202 [Colletotrichum karsti]KAF9874219.1 hypothetical protein CkaCkLH20_08202 [Colletotrichum karsti]